MPSVSGNELPHPTPSVCLAPTSSVSKIMVFTPQMGCTCSECVLRRWFPMVTHANKECGAIFPQIFEESSLRVIRGYDMDIGLLPQASVLSPSPPDASHPLLQTRQTPNVPPNLPQCATQRSAPGISRGPEPFTPRATSSPIEEYSPARPQPVFGKTSGLPLPDVPVRIPSNSAKRQKKKRSDFERAAPTPSNRLHVSNVPFHFREIHLISMFQGCGKPRQAEIIYNERGSKGFGFVTFESVKEATAILKKFHGKEVDGRVIEVNFASKRTPRKTNHRPLKNLIPDHGEQLPETGFVQLTPEPIGCKIDENQNICVKHKCNKNHINIRKFDRQLLKYKVFHADQNGQTGQNSQGSFGLHSAPAHRIPMNFSRRVHNGAMPNGGVGFQPTAKNSAQDMRVIRRVGRVSNFDVQNNVNEQITQQIRRQFKREVTAPNQIADIQRKMPSGRLPGSMFVGKDITSSIQPQADLIQQDLEFSKTSPDKENHPPDPNGNNIRAENANCPRPERNWFLNLKF